MIRTRPAGPRRPLSTTVIAAIATVAVAVAAAVIAGVAAAPPPAAASSPSTTPAPSATAPVLDAGIAHVDSVSGVLVLDRPYLNPSSHSHMAWTAFAATSAGDRKADVHYAVDWAGAAAAYRKALKDLAAQKTVVTPKELKDSRRQYAVVTRTLWVQDTASHTSTVVFFTADPRTRRPARAKYISLPFSPGLPPTMDHTESWRVWELATQIRAAMALQPGIRVANVVSAGVPAYHVTVPAADGAPAWSALVDRATGLTLSVAAAAPDDGGSVAMSSPYHVRDLRVNEPLPVGTFAVRPDYRVLPHPPGSPTVEKLDLADGTGSDEWFPPERLASLAPVSYLTPTRMPPGFTLAQVRRIRAAGVPTSILLVYRRGLSTLVSWSGRRMAGYSVSDSGVTQPDHIPVFDRTVWPPLGGYLIGAQVIDTLSGGALAGAPAALASGIGWTTQLEAWTSRDQVDLGGDATRAELLAAADSLQPLRAGAWHRPLSGVLSLVALIAAAAFVLATVWAWVPRAAGPAGRPSLSVLLWPLAGLVIVIVGACLEWHSLHTSPEWGMSGWSEPLGRWVVAAALAGVACAAWTQLVRGPRRRRTARTGALFLSAAALAGSLLALVYLPVVARFTVDPGNGAEVTSESWLLRIAASRFSPSASVGLYVSIVGALLLFVGVVLLRRRAVTGEALEAPQPGAPDVAGPAPAGPAGAGL